MTVRKRESADATSRVHTRFQRLFRVLTHIQSGPRFNVGQLARELGVTRRTIFRDIQFLRDIGFNIVFDQQAGGYRILSAVELPRPLALNPDDIALITVALRWSLARAIPEFSGAAESVLTKLLSICDHQTKNQLSHLLNACVLEKEMTNDLIFNDNVLVTIYRGIRRQRQIRAFFSEPLDGKWRQTKIAPYRIAASTVKWLLIGRSSVHRSTCTFDISQIDKVELTDDSYCIPQEFRKPPEG